MKILKNYILILTVISSFLISCSDYLEVTPNDLITEENFYQSEDDFQAATAALYNVVWFDFNDKAYFAIGDGRSYNLYAPYSEYIYPFSDLTETGLTGPLVSAWESLYNVVQQSNNVIIGISNSSVDEDIQKQYIAEARFMRGTAYWYLASLWGDVIISEDPSELVDNPVVNTNPVEDVYEFAMRDLEYAATYLADASYQTGRVTKYSAYAMLSRVYLSYSGLSDDANSGTRDETYLEMAQLAAKKVIEEGPYSLMDDYYDLFKVDNNNNSESIFALQWVPNGDYGVTNTQQNYFAASSDITGDSYAWGYYTRASVDVLSIYETTDIRRHDTWMGYGDYYSDISVSNGGYTYYLSKTALNVKKGVVGSTDDNSKISSQNSALNTYMIRLAEVYLNYVEATLGNNGSTNDQTAITYYNLLRNRAGVDSKYYLTFDEVFNERRRELCMEGQFWYDIVRWAYYEQDEAIDFIESQSRDYVMPFTYDSETNTITEDNTRGYTTISVGTIDKSIFLLPYPEAEVDQNPLLEEDPVDYEFTESRISLF